MQHLMIDLETMGNRSGCAILSIAAVQFNLETGKTGEVFEAKVDLQSCLDMGLAVQASTLNWWLVQSENARLKVATGTFLHLHHALLLLSEFVRRVGEDSQVWGNSARFDLGILEAAYDKCQLPLPWKFYNERDVRTLVSFAPEIKGAEPFLGDKHDPVHDCMHQIKYCHKTWTALKGGRDV